MQFGNRPCLSRSAHLYMMVFNQHKYKGYRSDRRQKLRNQIPKAVACERNQYEILHIHLHGGLHQMQNDTDRPAACPYRSLDHQYQFQHLPVHVIILFPNHMLILPSVFAGHLCRISQFIQNTLCLLPCCFLTRKPFLQHIVNHTPQFLSDIRSLILRNLTQHCRHIFLNQYFSLCHPLSLQKIIHTLCHLTPLPAQFPVNPVAQHGSAVILPRFCFIRDPLA